ncbi:hypothetical protein OUZ56_010815 [Daphnia magna]|uniref:Uncharacterized protein n=1 Tax=Daphnia magna TaxID=35525 RepID=A0ABQ9YZV6_9CRUS|nr:hypothetical protein OUZ56_010815 [Daphnia magna]
MTGEKAVEGGNVGDYTGQPRVNIDKHAKPYPLGPTSFGRSSQKARRLHSNGGQVLVFDKHDNVHEHHAIRRFISSLSKRINLDNVNAFNAAPSTIWATI